MNGEKALYALELTRQSIIEGDTCSRPISFLLSASERFFATGFVKSKSLGGFFTPEAQEGLTRCEGVPPSLCFGGTLGHPSARNELLPALGFRMLLSPHTFLSMIVDVNGRNLALSEMTFSHARPFSLLSFPLFHL